MRAMLLGLVLLAGCSSGEGPADAGPVDAGGDPVVVVALQWTWLEFASSCYTVPTCAPTCSDGSTHACTCDSCSGGNCTQPSKITEYCCSHPSNLKTSSLPRLTQDYPSCTLKPAPFETYVLDCGFETVHVDSHGNPIEDLFKYTTNRTCGWSLPYESAPAH